MLPNIVLTGTPGCGKTSLGAAIEKAVPGTVHVDLSRIIKEKKLYTEWDDELNASILDEDLVADYIDELYEQRMAQGGLIIDFHSVGFLPAEFFDRVFVLRCDTAVLWDRLLVRGYPRKKIEENIDCEIFAASLEEVADIFDQDLIQEISSNTPDDAIANQKIIADFFSAAMTNA